jgi:hypothetical protein
MVIAASKKAQQESREHMGSIALNAPSSFSAAFPQRSGCRKVQFGA